MYLELLTWRQVCLIHEQKFRCLYRDVYTNHLCDVVESAKVAQTGEMHSKEGEEDSPPLPAPLVRIPAEQQD